MKNNTIFNTILKNRKNHYIHVLEVETVYEIENCIEQIWSEFEEIATIEELKEFFNTMQIYYIGGNQDQETEIDNFNINKSIEELI